MPESSASHKVSVTMLRISILLLGFLVIGNWAAPTNEELQEIYVDTCQISCGVIDKDDETNECHEQFCPNYANYLLTGFTVPGSKPTAVSSDKKQVAKFCATWMINLLKELGWRRRIYLNLNDCNCAAGTHCFTNEKAK